MCSSPTLTQSRVCLGFVTGPGLLVMEPSTINRVGFAFVTDADRNSVVAYRGSVHGVPQPHGTRRCVAGRPCPASPPLKTPGAQRPGVLRGVAPAAYRRHRIVKRLLKSLMKTLSQYEKVKVVSKKASATGWGDPRVRRVRRQLPQRHRACVPRPGLSRAWLGGPAVSG